MTGNPDNTMVESLSIQENKAEYQGCTDITHDKKIENRPLDVKRKKRKSRKIPPKPQNDLIKDLPHLSIRHRLFLKYYTDPNSDTYNNATRSYMKVYPESNEQSAAVNAYKLLRGNKTKTWIEYVLEKAGADVQARVAALSDIMQGRGSTQTITREHYVDKTGETVTLTETRTPTAGEKVKAIDTLNKLGGDYDTQRHLNRLQEQQHKTLMSRMLKALDGKKSKTQKQAKGTDVTVAAQGNGGDGTEGGGIYISCTPQS